MQQVRESPEHVLHFLICIGHTTSLSLLLSSHGLINPALVDTSKPSKEDDNLIAQDAFPISAINLEESTLRLASGE
jgi:hypothetical protein